MILPHPEGGATMFGFYEKRKIKQFLHTRYFLAFMCLPLGFLSFTTYNAYSAQRESHERKVELQAQLAVLEERAQSLEDSIAHLEDPYGVEAELRQRYDVGREGEEAIILIEAEQEEATGTESEPVKEKGVWETMKGWF